MIGVVLIAVAFFLQLGGYLLYDPAVHYTKQDYVFDMLKWSHFIFAGSIMFGFRIDTFLRPANLVDFAFKWFFLTWLASSFYAAFKEQFAGFNDFYIRFDGAIYVALLCSVSIYLLSDYAICQKKSNR